MVLFGKELPNGVHYLRVISTRLRQSIRRGGTRQRHFAGTSFQPRKRLENAAIGRGSSPLRPSPIRAQERRDLTRRAVRPDERSEDGVHVEDPAQRGGVGRSL